MKFDRDKFYDGYRAVWGAVTSQQVAGLNFILDAAEQDTHLDCVEWLAYALATAKHETANTFQPIHEYGGHAYFVKRYGSQTAVGKRLGNKTAEDGAMYAGFGLVQLTGRSNYDKATTALRNQYPELVAAFETRTGQTFDLIKNAPQAGDPAIAYAVMSYGMRTGMFTGRKLADYISATRQDYMNARRIINGTDKASTIAGYAVTCAQILNGSLLTT